MNQVKILFLGGAKRVSLAERFLAAAKKAGVEIRLFSQELGDDVPVSSLATIIIGGKWEDEATFHKIRNAVEENQIDILIPLVDPATVLAALLKPQLTGCFVPVSDEETCKIFFNKISAQSWFLQNGFNVPVQGDSYPAIAKPALGSASQGIHVLKTREEKKIFFESANVSDYLLQKLIKGIEYTVDCYIAQQGKILAVIPRERLAVAGGEVIKTKTVDRPDLIEISKEIIGKANLRGPVNIQFIEDRDSREVFVMEVNPRFGGGVIAAIEAGSDMPLYVLNERLGVENVPLTAWNTNLLMMRANREFFRDAK